MPKMRAQIGLVFSDEDLFNNFIEPYKQQRELNSVIVRCLTAYYYNEEVRNMIEGVALEDVATAGVEITSSQEICNSIRESLMVQDFLTSELKDTIEGGQEDVDDILAKANDLATASGTVKSSETEFGKGYLKLEVKNLGKVASRGSEEESVEGTPTERMFHILFKAIVKLAEAQGNDEVLGILKDSEEVVTEVSEPEEQEISSETAVAESELPIEEHEEVSEQVEEETAVIDQDGEDTVEVEFEPVSDKPVAVVEETVEELPAAPIQVAVVEENNDARDSIRGLLGSLGEL